MKNKIFIFGLINALIFTTLMWLYAFKFLENAHEGGLLALGFFHFTFSFLSIAAYFSFGEK